MLWPFSFVFFFVCLLMYKESDIWLPKLHSCVIAGVFFSSSPALPAVCQYSNMCVPVFFIHSKGLLLAFVETVDDVSEDTATLAKQVCTVFLPHRAMSFHYEHGAGAISRLIRCCRTEWYCYNRSPTHTVIPLFYRCRLLVADKCARAIYLLWYSACEHVAIE